MTYNLTDQATVTTLRHAGIDLVVDSNDWAEVAHQVSKGRVGMRIRSNGSCEFYLTSASSLIVEGSS